jgi:hypothetical protein
VPQVIWAANSLSQSSNSSLMKSKIILGAFIFSGTATHAQAIADEKISTETKMLIASPQKGVTAGNVLNENSVVINENTTYYRISSDKGQQQYDLQVMKVVTSKSIEDLQNVSSVRPTVNVINPEKYNYEEK